MSTGRKLDKENCVIAVRVSFQEKQALDRAWKRNGYKSISHLVGHLITKACATELKKSLGSLSILERALRPVKAKTTEIGDGS